ncbi:MAG: hypothetical protein OEV64_13515 [Desulfobulbaceae bacterium]|nr:hypothetical protein [Desulfobulbaceae bacterium]
MGLEKQGDEDAAVNFVKTALRIFNVKKITVTGPCAKEVEALKAAGISGTWRGGRRKENGKRI